MGIQGMTGRHQKESVTRDMSHGKPGSGRGIGGGTSEGAEGVEIVGIKRKREEKGNIITVPPTKGQCPR